jgi:penicillin-binding protein 1A
MKRKRRSSTPSDERSVINKLPGRKEAARISGGVKKSRIFLLISLVIVLAGITIFLWYISQDLPSLTKLEHINPSLASQVYSIDSKIIDNFHYKNRTIVSYYKFPEYLVQALIATEDRRFYNHWGVNIYAGMRALLVNVAHLHIVQGSSTLTMQLARNLYFGLARTWTRKLKEILTSIQIERTYSKREIIEMYLNVNFFGSNAYGIQSAAQTYFSKNTEDLTIEECALLIGLLKAQSDYNPITNPQKGLLRRNIVLHSMLEEGYLTKTQYDSLKKIPLRLKPASEQKKIAPYFTEYVRLQLNQLQDSLQVNVYEDGLRIYTTLDTRIQHYMDDAVQSIMPEFQRRVRSKSSLLQRLNTKSDSTLTDSMFNELTTVQIAFVCLDPHSGQILAMIGGRDFEKYKYNRAVQAPRQPGSAFKPFVYTAAMDNGYTPADEFLNQPFVLINDDGTRWTPHNYENDVSGLMSLREALAASKNLVTIRLIQEIGPALVVDYAKRMGITTRIRAVPSLALGSSEVYLLDLVSAFSVFANNGIHFTPISILKIEDKTGNVIYQNRSPGREVLRRETAYIMNDLMQGVVNYGTAYALRRDFQLTFPIGGKTGTTNEYTDAWFIGFTPQLSAGVWVGFDDPQLSLGRNETGAIAALPFWGQFMKTVYDSLQFPSAQFDVAPNVVRVKICKETKKLATPFCPQTIEELFMMKNVPTETCDVHTGKQTLLKDRKRQF